MSLLTFSDYALEEPPRYFFIIVIILFVFGLAILKIILSEEPKPKGERPSSFKYKELGKACAWFIMLPFRIGLAIVTIVVTIVVTIGLIGLIGLVLIGIIKAIKFAWFF